MRFVVEIAIAGLLLVAVKWAFLHGRRMPRHRVHYLRVRLLLRLHPGQGHANVVELWWRWGRVAVLRHARRSRPSLGLAGRLLSPRFRLQRAAGQGALPAGAAPATR